MEMFIPANGFLQIYLLVEPVFLSSENLFFLKKFISSSKNCFRGLRKPSTYSSSWQLGNVYFKNIVFLLVQTKFISSEETIFFYAGTFYCYWQPLLRLLKNNF